MIKQPFSRNIFLNVILSSLIAIGVAFFFSTCKKDANASKPANNEQTTKKVTTNFPQCPDGFHWDVTSAQCVEDCPDGYVFCPELGYCVPNGNCGSNTPEINISSIQDNSVLTEFQALNVNFSQLSSELGLSYTLS